MKRIAVGIRRGWLGCLLFAFTLASAPCALAARTVCITEQTETSLTFAFGEADGIDYDLFVAHGPTDAGDDKGAWASFEKVAEIGTSQTSFTYEVPAVLRDGRHLRFFLMQTIGVNMAKEYKSIRSSGAQWIDTGIAPTTTWTVDFRFGDPVYSNQTAFFGQNWTGSRYLFNQQGNVFKFHGSGNTVGPMPASGVDYRCVIDNDNYLGLTGSDGTDMRTAISRAVGTGNFAIFGCNDGSRMTTFSFYRMKIADDDVPVRDFVPAANAAGDIGLYDQVNNVFYPNKTATAFTAGDELPAARVGRVADTTPSFSIDSASFKYTFLTLATDTAWADIAATLADCATIDLNGHELATDDYAAFYAKGVTLSGSGAFRVSVPQGATLTFSTANAPAFSGRLVKDGPGTLVLSSKLPGVTGVEVAGGIVKYGAQTLLNKGITVEVKSGAAFDLNGAGNGNVVYYKIAGTGPDGAGALRSTGGDVGSSSQQMTGLELTADATIGGTGHLGLINTSYAATKLELNGHTLTIDLESSRGFWICNTTATTGGTIYVKSGIPYFHNTESSLPNVDFVIDSANSTYRVNAKGTVRNVTLVNGGKMDQNGASKTVVQNITAIDSDVPANGNRWVCVADTALVSNDTANVTIVPPFTSNGTYPRLVKKGSKTLTLAISHSENRIDRGVEIFGGTVVMSSSRSTPVPQKAISSQAVPVTIHNGGTLDMRECGTAAFLVTTLQIDEGGTLLHAANNVITISGANTFTRPLSFLGTMNLNGNATFDVASVYSGAGAPAAGATVTLISAGTLNVGSGVKFTVTGCPYDSYIVKNGNAVELRTAPVNTANPAIKIWTVGGSYAFGNTTSGDSFRIPLAQALAANEGWNVHMTGWRTATPNGASAPVDAWKRHAGVKDLALKTSATRAGLLEGLETYAAAANEPDFTLFLCGDTDVADGVADATVFANYTNAVKRIKAALPMTTVIACTIPGASAALNADIAAWCGTEADVECVDISSAITSAQTLSECEAVAAAIKAKLTTLATASGKIAPSGWTRPAVTLGAENNVPADYRAGFTRVRSIEPPSTFRYAQDLAAIPYAYAPVMRETGIEKVGYYIELVRRDTGALQAMWIDMDAPGSAWADVALPVTVAQQKKQAVTKLHVWSNFGGVSPVAANDDSVTGFIEFNPLNYTATETSPAGGIAEPWEGAYGFDDTFPSSGANGHACFQVMRKFADASAFPGGEILFAYNRWGGTSAQPTAIGMGTLADYGNLGYNNSKALDWTFTYGADGSDVANISGGAYSFIRIDFWVKYSAEAPAPARAELADCTWSGATDSAFATAGNWTEGDAAATTLAGKNILVPSGATPTFTYIGYDPVSLTSTTLMMDGAATFPEVGGFYLGALDMGATGKLTYDPTKFTFRLVAAPVFASGAKIALSSEYAANTKGRFLLMTWDNGSLDMSQADLNTLFDTSSANGTDVKVWAENLESGGRLWLDLDYSGAHPQLNLLCVGDSITQGSDSSYGNWRTLLMKKLAAAGYRPVAKGHWSVHSHDICMAEMPDEWVWHSGISGQRLVTVSGGAGTYDAIENMLDCAGDVDFVLVKLGTNDINGSGKTANDLFPVWTNLVWKTLTQKPHAKFIAGAVVDIAYSADKNAQVVAYNTMMSNATVNATFPAKRTYFADLYTPCYRYSVLGDPTTAYIEGSFLSATNLHPDWPGEDKMAATYRDAILRALADDPDFTTGEEETVVPVNKVTGAENNIPAAFLTGMTRARTFDIATNSGVNLATLGYVPYSYSNPSAPTENISRVGYYIELKRKDTARGGYHDLVRWIWVSMDAFGNRTIDDVGIPLTTVNQRIVNRLRVVSNMPGVESTSATAMNVRGWVEFWPSSYTDGDCGNSDAPANVFRYDWNDTRTDNMSGFGSMQVHRLTPGESNPAQVMFSFNRWTTTDPYEIGIGNFSHQGRSVDWTHTGNSDTREMMSSLAYEVAKIEIWTGGAEADIEPSAGYWRPQATGDVWTDAAWKKDGTGANVTLNPDWTANFDGSESVTTPTVQVPSAVGAAEVVVKSATDYTFTGAGSVSAPKFVKDGTGTVTLDAAVLAGTPDIEVKEGVVKLSDDAAPGAAGADNGTITVMDGAQFDLNFYDTTGANNRPRANITNKKKFVIEGAGPDGSGAITSSRTSTPWNNALNEIELAGDATIGGNARIEVRGNAKNIVHGPDDATLTIKTNAGTGSYYEGFGFTDGTLAVGKVVVAEGGLLKFENATIVDVPHGIDLYGKLGFWAGSATWNTVVTALGPSASIGNNSGTATFNAPLTVAPGATFSLAGTATIDYPNVVTNKGEIVKTSGTHNFTGEIVNVGNPLWSFSASRQNFFPAKVTGDSRMSVSGIRVDLNGQTDWGESALDVAISGNTELVLGQNGDGYGLPKFGKDKLSVTAGDDYKGTVYLYPTTSSSIDGLSISGTINSFRSQGPTANSTDAAPRVVDIHANNLSFTANDFQLGNNAGRGELHVTGERSDIHAKGLYLSWHDGTARYAGALSFEGGLLGIGTDGITMRYYHPTRTVFSMANGTLKADADFGMKRPGMTATFGGPMKGGAVDIALNGRTVKWNTGLAGASDVTIKGAGAFTSERPGIQGIPTGKWRVESTGTVDLRNAAGFAGGLSLAEGTSATLDIAGDSMVEMRFWTWGSNAWNAMRPLETAGTAESQHLATSLTYINRPASQVTDTKYSSGTGINYFGQFYVSADRAGTWTFAHSGQTHNGLRIDTTDIDQAGAGSETKDKTINLAEGWHTFMISLYTNASNPTIGPKSGATSTTDSYLFKAPGDSAYQPFDTTTVPMRMRQNVKAHASVRWRKAATYADSPSKYLTLEEGGYNTIDVVTNSLQALNLNPNLGASGILGGCSARFDGYFKVTEENAGLWEFKGQFDDRIALFVDGRQVFATGSWSAIGTGVATLREGWHKFEIRTADGCASGSTTGASGASKVTADGRVCAVAFKAGSGDYKPFDERYLKIVATANDAQKFEKPGLGGEIELAAGSTLTNDVRAGGWCPIYGTLKGSGTLAGPFRFTGEDNCWEISGTGMRLALEGKVSLDSADANALNGLRRLKVTLTTRMAKASYPLGPATSLDNTVDLEVIGPEGTDVSSNFSLAVENGILELRNGNPNPTCNMITVK